MACRWRSIFPDVMNYVLSIWDNSRAIIETCKFRTLSKGINWIIPLYKISVDSILFVYGTEGTLKNEGSF